MKDFSKPCVATTSISSGAMTLCLEDDMIGYSFLGIQAEKNKGMQNDNTLLCISVSKQIITLIWSSFITTQENQDY